MWNVLSSWRIGFLASSMIIIGIGFGACGPPKLGPTSGSNQVTTPGEDPARPTGADSPFQQPYQTGDAPNYVPITHLALCNGDTDCTGKIRPDTEEQECNNLLGEPLCYYPCDPKKGSGDKQNPDCLQPENCLEVTGRDANGNEVVRGYCIYIPGQLYGNGSYKAIIRKKQGEQCLIRYGGCDTGLLCVDVRGTGSIGTCEPECIPSQDAAENQRRCASVLANTKCTLLASGFGACLP